MVAVVVAAGSQVHGVARRQRRVVVVGGLVGAAVAVGHRASVVPHPHLRNGGCVARIHPLRSQGEAPVIPVIREGPRPCGVRRQGAGETVVILDGHLRLRPHRHRQARRSVVAPVVAVVVGVAVEGGVVEPRLGEGEGGVGAPRARISVRCTHAHRVGSRDGAVGDQVGVHRDVDAVGARRPVAVASCEFHIEGVGRRGAEFVDQQIDVRRLVAARHRGAMLLEFFQLPLVQHAVGPLVGHHAVEADQAVGAHGDARRQGGRLGGQGRHGVHIGRRRLALQQHVVVIDRHVADRRPVADVHAVARVERRRGRAAGRRPDQQVVGLRRRPAQADAAVGAGRVPVAGVHLRHRGRRRRRQHVEHKGGRPAVGRILGRHQVTPRGEPPAVVFASLIVAYGLHAGQIIYPPSGSHQRFGV